MSKSRISEGFRRDSLAKYEQVRNVQFDCLQWIQVECVMGLSIVAFVAPVELIALRGKMTDVARRECQRSAWENHNMLSPRQNIISAT